MSGFSVLIIVRRLDTDALIDSVVYFEAGTHSPALGANAEHVLYAWMIVDSFCAEAEGSEDPKMSETTATPSRSWPVVETEP